MVAIRTKAMKALSAVVSADPSILSRVRVRLSVQDYFSYLINDILGFFHFWLRLEYLNIFLFVFFTSYPISFISFILKAFVQSVTCHHRKPISIKPTTSSSTFNWPNEWEDNLSKWLIVWLTDWLIKWCQAINNCR